MYGKKILFVSNDSFDLKFLTKKVEESGVKCDTAQTNKEVEDALQKKAVCVLIINYATRGFSVKRFTKFLADNEFLDQIPIIVVMTRDDVTVATHFLYEFSDDFLIKPFDPQVIVIKVKTAIRKKIIMDEIRDNLRSIQDRNNKELYEEKLGILKEITSNIANELKDPVNFIKNFSEISIANASALVIKKTDDIEIDEKNRITLEKLIENLNTIYKYASQLDSGMRFLLNQSSMKKGDTIKTKVTSLLDNSFQLSLQKLKKELGHQQVMYETNYDLWNQKITIDPVNMQRAFSLIFDNAIEAIIEIEDDKIVHIVKTETKFDSKEKILIIRITDNGVGIPGNVIGSIFKPFFTTKPGHHGLGLATVREIVEKSHMGEVSVSSELDKSTTVTIKLPAIEKTSEQESISENVTSNGVWMGGDEGSVIEDKTERDDTEEEETEEEETEEIGTEETEEENTEDGTEETSDTEEEDSEEHEEQGEENEGTDTHEE